MDETTSRQNVQHHLRGPALELQAERVAKGETRRCVGPLRHHDNGGDLRPSGEKYVRGGYAVCLLWATFPNIREALRVMEAWGFEYRTAAFVWIKKNRKNGGNFWGMGAYTRANAEVCLLGTTPGTKARQVVKSHGVQQVIEAPVERHSRKPAEVRERIVRLLGDVPRIELFARERVPGWDAWGNEV